MLLYNTALCSVGLLHYFKIVLVFVGYIQDIRRYGLDVELTNCLL